MDEAMQRLLNKPRGSLLLLLLQTLLVLLRCGIIHTNAYCCIGSLRTLQMLRYLVRTHKQ